MDADQFFLLQQLSSCVSYGILFCEKKKVIPLRVDPSAASLCKKCILFSSVICNLPNIKRAYVHVGLHSYADGGCNGYVLANTTDFSFRWATTLDVVLCPIAYLEYGGTLLVFSLCVSYIYLADQGGVFGATCFLSA